MALIKCSECGNEMSDKAMACPKCGYPINSSNEVKLSSVPERKPLDMGKVKKIGIIVAIVLVVIFIVKGFIHPDLKFEDLKFGDAMASSLLGYSSGTNSNGKYWDNCIKLYGLKVDHVEYYDGWYMFYFSEEKGSEAHQIIYDYCNSTVISGLYYDEAGELAVWWDGKQDFGDYKGYYRIKVTKSQS